MNVENRAEAALFPEKEYIKGIFVAVPYDALSLQYRMCSSPANERSEEMPTYTMWFLGVRMRYYRSRQTDTCIECLSTVLIYKTT